MDAREREREWMLLMNAALDGDEQAYRRFLTSVSLVIRSAVRRRFGQFGVGLGEVEDVVQETLLAIHLKRHTWVRDGATGPWIFAIARNKVVDALRRHGRRAEVPLDLLGDGPLTDEGEESGISRSELDRLIGKLKAREQDIVRSISIEGYSVRETAERLKMSEVAVRVALHRSLKALSAIYQRGHS